MFRLVVVTLVFAHAAAVPLAAAAAPPALPPPFDLRVETLADPLLIDNAAPRFSWRVGAAAEQSAYRVLVWRGTAPAPGGAGAPVEWDSGEVASNATAQVAYAGARLVADADYRWLVASRDGGSGGAWANASAPGRFSTGLLAAADWAGAAWVGGRNQLRAEFTLAAGADVSRARAFVTGVGFYELWVNGVRVANDTSGRETLANPGFSTVFSRRVLYNAYDVAPLLRAGQANAVGIRLGMGKFGYLGEFCVDAPDACNSAILRLSVGAAPAATALVTSGQWLAARSAILADHLYNGETVDARVERAQQGWAAPGFAPGAEWAPATVRAAPPTATLSAHTMPQIAPWEAPRVPVSVARFAAADAAVFDFGVNGAGRCTLSLPGPTEGGATYTLLLGETLFANGTVHVGFGCPCACCADGGNCANQSFTFITAGVPAGEAETFRPTFAYSGFRWAQLAGPGAAALPAAALTCEATSSGVAATGSVGFGEGTPEGRLLNGVQALVVRTQRSNLHSIPTDCPQREKRGWMADASVSADEASLNLDMQLVYENWLRTHADTAAVGCGPLPPNATCPKWHSDQPGGARLVGGDGGVATAMNPWSEAAAAAAAATAAAAAAAAASAEVEPFPNCYICCAGRPGFGCVARSPTNVTGSIADVVPFDKNGYGSFPGSISWMSASFSVASVLLSRIGATQQLRAHYAALKAHLLFYNWNSWANNNATGLVYWDQYGDWNSLVPTAPLLPANVYYFSDALFMADLAAQIGEPDDALAFLGLTAYLNAELPANFAVPANASAAVWDMGSQCAQAMPLYWGIGGDIFPNLTDGSLAALVADVAARDNHYTVGTLGSRFLLQALSTNGRGDVALALAAQTSYPSIGAMVNGTAEQPALGTLWEGWGGPMSSVGSSGNHIMLGGGIGEWLYSHALGLRVHVRRRVPVGEEAGALGGDGVGSGGASGGGGGGVSGDGVSANGRSSNDASGGGVSGNGMRGDGVSARARGAACLRELGFGIDLRATHGLAARDACLLARVLRRFRSRRAAGDAPAGELVEFSRLRDAIQAERRAAVAEGAWEGNAAAAGEEAEDAAARAATPSARLVVDEHVARVLRSAHGSVATPRGPLAAKWRLSSETALTVEVDVPAGLQLDVYLPLALLRGGGGGGMAPGAGSAGGAGKGGDVWSATVTREGELAPHWSAEVSCGIAELSGVCVVDSESRRFDGGRVAWAWALRGEANDRAPRAGEAAVEHLRVRVPQGRWSVDVG